MRKKYLRIPRKGGFPLFRGEEAERSGRMPGVYPAEHSGVSADEVAGLPELE